MKYKTDEMYRIRDKGVLKTGCAQRIDNGFWIKWHDGAISFLGDIQFIRKRFEGGKRYESELMSDFEIRNLERLK